MKEGFVVKSGEREAPDMDKINQYTRRSYGPEEVYAFSLVLCDNEVDRDFERFSVPALEKLRDLFPGKTCIFDHERKSAGQTARIYDTALEADSQRKTRAGEDYVRLAAKAYLPRTGGTRETIELIESGILKEVSVSCSVKRSVCGVCGKETCGHQKGKDYGEGVGHRVLLDPTDAYECSFVAVPAQRSAGVTKHKHGEGERVEQELGKLFSQAGEEGVCIGREQAGEIARHLESLEEKARWGDAYRESLSADILKYSAVVQPEMPIAVMKAAIGSLSLSDLSLMGKTFEKMAQKSMPLKPQLGTVEKGTKKTAENKEFRI